MKDIIAKYKKQNLAKNTGLVAMSLVLAFGINYSLQGTSIGQKLQASVINSTTNSSVGDIYLAKNSDKVNLKANKDINDVVSISLSFTFNPTNVKIDSIIPSKEGKINILGRDEGIKTLILNFDKAINIKSGENILDLAVAKKEEKLENINIVNANFTTSKNEVFMFSTSGLEF